jgi:dihydrofolate reductase
MSGPGTSTGTSTVTLIAAVAANGVIGRDGDIPWRLPGEQKLFKARTVGHVLVMGRRTYESIGRPLPGRTTIVVTRQPGWHAEGVLVATGVPEALARAAEVDDEVYVAGGQEVYREALPVADRMVITRVEARPDGDTVFPPVDWAGWSEVDREPHDGFEVVTYQRRGVSVSP